MFKLKYLVNEIRRAIGNEILFLSLRILPVETEKDAALIRACMEFWKNDV